MPRHPLLVVILLFTPLVGAADWPQIFGLNRDSRSTEIGLNWAWDAKGPPLAWSREVGSGFAGVAVADGKVFLFHRVKDEERLESLEPATGKTFWTFSAPTRYRDDFDFDNGPRCVPTVSGGRVFALGANGDLHAVDAKTGKRLWYHNLRDEYKTPKGYFGIGSAPIVIADRLLVNVGAKGAGIVAFDPATGKELWKATDDPASYAAPVAAERNGKPIAVFFTRSGLAVLNPVNGDVIFQHPWRSRLDASVNAASPVVKGNEIFLTSSYGTGAILFRESDSGYEEVWSGDRSLSAHYNTPVRVGDYLYGIDGRQEGGAARLRCVEWKTGDVKWSVDRFGCAGLIAVDGGLLAITEGGEAIRFDADPKKFTERARSSILDGTVRAMAALSDGRLYVRNESKLVCVRLK